MCLWKNIFSSFFCNVIIFCFNCILNIEMLLIITVLLFNFFFWLFHIFHFQEFLYQLHNCTNVAIGGHVTSYFKVLQLNYRMFLLNCSKVHTLKAHSCATFLQRFIYSSAIKAKLNKIHTKLWFRWDVDLHWRNLANVYENQWHLNEHHWTDCKTQFFLHYFGEEKFRGQRRFVLLGYLSAWT